MASFKKYLLVDPVKYQQLLDKTQSAKANEILAHPNIQAVKEIDNKISSILNDDEKSDQQKVEEYSNNLESYLRNFKNALEVSKRDAILGQGDIPGDIKDEKLKSSDAQSKQLPVINKDSIPVSYRPSASHLTSFLDRNKNFEIDDGGVVKYKGKSTFNSDYHTLLDSVVRAKQPPIDSKIDIDNFVSLLKQEGYPVKRLGYVRRNNISSNENKVIKRLIRKPVKTNKHTKINRNIERANAVATPNSPTQSGSGFTTRRHSSSDHFRSKIFSKWQKV